MLWLLGNTFEMYGECHDVYYNTDASNPKAALSDQAEIKAGFIFWAAFVLIVSLCIARFVRGRFGFERFSKASKDIIRLKTIASHHPYESNSRADQQGSSPTEAPRAAEAKCVLHKFGLLSHVIRTHHATHLQAVHSGRAPVGCDGRGFSCQVSRSC